MDRRAVKTLTDTYWSPQGWREPPSTPSKDDLEHAKQAGVMFDGPTREHHDAVVTAALAARDAVDEDEALDGFLSSLTSRRLELRSALGSLAVARHLEEHAFDDDDGRCRTCGLWEYEDIDRNVMSFERIRWGGARRDDLVYVAFDLERFAAGEHPEATDDDRALLDALFDDLEHAPPETTASKAAKERLRDLAGNKDERGVVLDILGVCSVLETDEHRGYRDAFVQHADRELPDLRFVERIYPVCWWTAADGVNREALKK